VDQDSEDDAPRLQVALAGLIGLRLAKAFRWHQVDIFNFGPSVESRRPDGTAERRPRYSLHLQCAWGLLRDGRALVGRYNALVLEADEDGQPLHEEDDCARLLREYMDEDPGGRRRVTGVRLARGSDLDIALDDGSVLGARALRWVDPDRPRLNSEYWRLLDAAPGGAKAQHVVRRGPTVTPPWSAGVGPWSEEPGSTWDGPTPAPEAARAAVAVLTGEPFRRSARHDETETFRLGPVIEFSKPEGGTGLTPRYLLRLGCEWALVRAGRVLTGFEDYMYPPHDEEEGEDGTALATETVAGIDLRWRNAPAVGEPRLRDAVLEDFFAEAGGWATPRIVTSARLSGGWDLDIDLTDGTVLEVRPRHHLADGWWYWELSDVQERTFLLADGDGVSMLQDEPDGG
jgi:hypothetical protein